MPFAKKITIFFVGIAIIAGAVLGRGFLYLGYLGGNISEGKILFVGDVMLARNVERVMLEDGILHPFSKIRDFHALHEYVVGNFEGSVPPVHVPTKSFGFSFSVPKESIPALKDAGFTHLSIANNHALDFKGDGFEGSKAALADAGIVAFGDPTDVGEPSVATIDVEGKRVALIGVHAVWNDPDLDRVAKLFKTLRQTTDVQIVYIHWGEEYAPIHSTKQEALARKLIAFGADAVVGHHPHVVQDIGMIDGVPVFYSLGNYVFDQYWDRSVELGLALEMQIDGNELAFFLIPIESHRSVPEILSGRAKDDFLRELAMRSDRRIAGDIARGKVRAEARALATLE